MGNRDYLYGQNKNLASFGQFGLRALTGSSVTGETFVVIMAIEDSVVSTAINEYDGNLGDSSLTSLSLSKGMAIYGRFQNIVVASGKVIAYLG
jgi:hypothetical protein